MTRRKAILHIGTMKTGTSSIQAMLAQNADWLAARGYAFAPGVQRTSAAVRDRISKLTPDQNLIISDEGLWHFANSFGSDTAQIATALQDFDVTVVVYFRRPDQFMESWFVQGLKNGTGYALFSDFEKSAFVKAGCDFPGRLAIFRGLFGDAHIRIAPYERAQLAHGDVVLDFLQRTGLCLPGETHDTLAASGVVWPTRENISPDGDMILLTSLLRQMGKIPESLLKQVQASAAPGGRPKTSLLHRRERDRIIARYRGSFEALQRDFGAGGAESFFLDWDSGKEAPTCLLRPAYDGLIETLNGPDRTGLTPQLKNIHPKGLRVLFVIQKLSGLSGGAERMFIETAEALAARGISVRMVSFDPRRPMELAFGNRTVSCRSLFPRQLQRRRKAETSKTRHAGSSQAEHLLKKIPNAFPLTHAKWLLSHGLFEAMIKRYLRRQPIDVVVAFLPPAITAAVRAAAAVGVPVIASTHNLPEQDFGDSPRWDHNPVYRTRARQALAQAARVTVLQPDFVKWFPEAVQSRVVYMPNPVSRLSPPLPYPTTRTHIILGVGRLARIKRWDLLISAFASIAVQLPDWHLRLFGEGPEQAALAAQIDRLGLKEQISLCPPTPDIAAKYDQAAILAHPSEFEGFGLSVAEAMAHGLPIVAYADCPGINSLIENGSNGLLLPRTSDAEAVVELAAALLMLAQAKDLRDRLGQAATAITARFDRNEIYDTWFDMLCEVAKA